MKKFFVRYGSFLILVLWIFALIFFLSEFNELSDVVGPLAEWSEDELFCYYLGAYVVSIVLATFKVVTSLHDCNFDWFNRKKE